MSFSIENLQEQYKQLHKISPTPQQDLQAIEDKLGVYLPFDFKYINSFYDGTVKLRNTPLLPFSSIAGKNNFIEANLHYREVHLLPSSSWLALSPIQSHFPCVLMHTQANRKLLTPIWLINPLDLILFFKQRKLQFAKPIYFASYRLFFSYLLGKNNQTHRKSGHSKPKNDYHRACA